MSNFSFDYSISPFLKQMRASIKATKYVIPEVAVEGKHTLLVARASVGKSLISLRGVCDQIKAGEVNGSDVIYMTGDAGFEDIVEKAEILQQFGIEEVYVDSFRKFKMRRDFYQILEASVKEDNAKGKILIVDVLRNVSNPMDKREMQRYNESVNKFLLAGGTVITCTHANKYLDSDGKPIPEGTSEVRDGCDCVFLISKNEDDNNAYITMHRDKAKCVVSEKVRYMYPKNAASFNDLFKRCRYVSEQEAENIHSQLTSSEDEKQLLLDQPLIDSTKEIIADLSLTNSNTKINIRDQLTKKTNITFFKSLEILDRYENRFWIVEDSGKNNAKLYSLIPTECKTNFADLTFDEPMPAEVL